MEPRRKILIADQFEFDIQEIRKALIVEGYEVRVAKSEADVLPYLESFKPDLLILESKMLGLEPSNFIHQLRSAQSGERIPIVIASSQKSIDERIGLLELDVDEFIYKPFEVDEVLARLEILIKEVQKVEEAPQIAAPGFNGSLAEMSLVDLLQTLEVGKKTAVVTLNRSGSEGKVYVTDGQVIDAELESLPPKKALLRMFTWNAGQFSVSMKAHQRAKRIFDGTRELISEGVTRLYRWEQLSRHLPSLQSIALRAPAKQQQAPTKDEQKMIDLIDGKKRFIDLAEASPFDELKALRLLKTLFEKGLIVEAPTQDNAMTEEYLEKFKIFPQNGHSKSEVLEGIFSALFRKPHTFDQSMNERRKVDRRRRDRRRADRRRGYGKPEHKIFLNRSELIMVREKLLAGIKKPQNAESKG